ncbi:MAG: hypothetical protein GY953_23225, partial [bacterium]|nr:hypothetical protein [bacterium]
TPVDPATAPTTAGDLRLPDCSPAIDVGDNTANAEATDLDGNTRVRGGTLDLGAYEYATNIPAAYCTWIKAQFPGETDPATIGILADPNGDGVSNGLAFITGYQANADSPDALGIAEIAGSILSIEFTEVDEAASLNSTIEGSIDLQTWEPLETISPHVSVNLSGSSGQTTIRVEADLTQIPRLFYRQTFEPYPAP